MNTGLFSLREGYVQYTTLSKAQALDSVMD